MYIYWHTLIIRQLILTSVIGRINNLTCFRICAAMWWLQSKIMRNSRLLFISLRRGLVSCVSRGSWRIFSRMLNLDGAIISSCSLIRPSKKWHKWRKVVLFCCLFVSTETTELHIYVSESRVTKWNSILCSPVLSSYTTVAVFHLRNCTRSRIA